LALSYWKAVLAAVLEQPPQKPQFIKGTPWHERLDALRLFRRQQERWRRIGKALDGQHVPFREVHNTPSPMRGMHGGGTLRKPIDARITDCNIVHTRPNHAWRRAHGQKGPQRQDEIERQQEDIRAARLAIESGTWGQHQAEHLLEAA
jgi:hypothetical protein